jgi:hypothetical protein
MNPAVNTGFASFAAYFCCCKTRDVLKTSEAAGHWQSMPCTNILV